MENSIPWVEKYRPTHIEDIILDKYVEQQINVFLEDQPDVHLIITGMPGIGKTSTVRCIAKKILGSNIGLGYLELNAAEDRGIKSISTIVPPFCKKMVDFTCSKIILLDEADNMTPKCQYDINNMIKQYGHKTKFIFVCNESAKIISDIQSVCRIIRFKKLTDTQIKNYLMKICKTENIKFDDPGLNIICYISDGDMRKAINDLQKTAYTFNKISEKAVLNVCKVPNPKDIKNIIDLCAKKDLEAADAGVLDIIREGYYYLDIISGFVYVLFTYKISEDLRLRLVNIVNKTKIVISTGLRSKLQLSGMLCRMIREMPQTNEQ